jgi:hypothetical protein
VTGLPLTHVRVLLAAQVGAVFRTDSPGFLCRSYASFVDGRGEMRGRDVTAVVRKLTVEREVPLLHVGPPFGPQLRLWRLTEAGESAVAAEIRPAQEAAGASRADVLGVDEPVLDVLMAALDGLAAAGYSIVRDQED